MFGGSGKRRGFVRTDVSSTERVLSYALMILIVGIGIAIFMKGQIFDPELFALDPSYLENIPQARESMKLYEPGFGPQGEIAGSVSLENGMFSNLAPAGWEQMGDIESFTAETLYEKINGRAEQYLAYDVKGMQFVGLAAGNEFIDVFVYDMGEPLHAFGIYSVERTEGAPSLSFGREGYRVEASYFFWKNKYYVQVLGSATGKAIEEAVYTVSQKLDNRIEDAEASLWGLTALPKEDRIADTAQYFKRDALSLDFLKNAYTARYAKGDSEVTAFISQQITESEADQVLEKYVAYLTDYGTIAERKNASGTEVVVGDLGGFYDVVFKRGDMIGGVTMTDNRVLAESMVTKWLSTLRAGANTESEEEEY